MRCGRIHPLTRLPPRTPARGQGWGSHQDRGIASRTSSRGYVQSNDDTGCARRCHFPVSLAWPSSRPSLPNPLSRARVPKLLTGIAEIFCFSLLTAATDLPAGAFLWFDVLVTVSVLGLVLNIIFLVAYYMEQGP